MTLAISYGMLAAVITVVWLAVGAVRSISTRRLDMRRAFYDLLVYICAIVVIRFTFFPFSRVNGEIGPLIFDSVSAFPPRINLIPFVNLFDYEIRRELWLNLIGNTAMFLPLGIVWPLAFRQWNTHGAVLLSGFCTSLCIEILQLPFYDRVTDIDDLILNTVGFAVGYGILLSVRRLIRMKKTASE